MPESPETCISCPEGSTTQIEARCKLCGAPLCTEHIFGCNGCGMPMCRPCWTEFGKIISQNCPCKKKLLPYH